LFGDTEQKMSENENPNCVHIADLLPIQLSNVLSIHTAAVLHSQKYDDIFVLHSYVQYITALFAGGTEWKHKQLHTSSVSVWL
jgi:hypothetical protein